MQHKAMSPNQREALSAISTITSQNEYLTSTNGALNIAGSFSVTGGATSANQTNGQQLVQIVDAGGEAATVTGGKLDVNATASLAGTALPISGATTAVGVAIVDSSGNQISSFGGGTQYAEGNTTTPATGNAILARYNTTLPTLTNGQLNTPQLDSRGGLQIVVTDKDGTSGAVVGSQGTNIVTNINGLQTRSTLYGQFDDVSPGALTEDRLGIQRMSANRNAYTTLRDAAGNERGANVTASNALVVDGSAVTQPISGTVTANAGTNLNTSLLALESGGNLASIKTDVDNLNLSIGSTTSGQKGNLILTATTTAAPTYTTTQSNPLSTTTTGLLRVDGSGVTQPVSLTSTTITGTVAVTQSTSPWIVAGGGTAGSAATGVVTVQGIASMTPVQVSQATAASLNATVVGTGTFVVQNTPIAPSTIFNGRTTVTTAGTRVVLASSQAVQSVTVKALAINTGLIYVGNSTVSSSNGFQLAAGDSVSMDIANLTTVNIDSSVNGEGVTYAAVN